MKCANIVFILISLVRCDSSLEVETQKSLQACEADPLAVSCTASFFDEGEEFNRKPKQLLLTEVAKDGYISAKDHESQSPIYEFEGHSNVYIKYSIPLAKGLVSSCKEAVIDQFTAPLVSEFPESGEHFICVKLSDKFQDRFFYKSPIFIVDRVSPEFVQDDVLTGRPFLFSWEFTEPVNVSWSYNEEHLLLESHGEDAKELNTDFAFTATGLSEGSFPIKVTVMDLAGNAVSQSFQFGWNFTQARTPVFAGINQVAGVENSRDFTEAIVSWQLASGECTRMDISISQAAAHPNFTNPVATTNCQTTTVIINDLDPYTEYFFQVRAVYIESENEYSAGEGIEMSRIIQPSLPSGDQLSQAILTEIIGSVDKIDLIVTEATGGYFNKNLIWKSVGTDEASASEAVRNAAATNEDNSGPMEAPIVSLNAEELAWSDINVEIGTSCYLAKSVYDDGQYYLASENEQVFCKTPQYVAPIFSGVVSGKVVGSWPDGSHKIELTFAGAPIGSIEEYRVYFSQTNTLDSFDTNAAAFDIVDVGHSIQDVNANDAKILVGEGQDFTGGFFLVRHKFYGSPSVDDDTNTQVSSFVAPHPLISQDFSAVPMVQFGEAYSQFGRALDISEDSLTLVVGALLASTGTNRDLKKTGVVYIFTRATTGDNWLLLQKISAPEGHGNTLDYFGLSVAISGSSIIVGARNADTDANNQSVLTNAGAAYVFVESGGVWTLQQKLVALGINSRMNSDDFGHSVDINGDTAVVGARYHDYDESGENLLSNSGAAFVFSRVGGNWSQVEKIVGEGTNGRAAGDEFGYDVAVDNGTVVVGARYQDYDAAGANVLANSGAVFVYTLVSGDWIFEQKLVGVGSNGRIANDWMGLSVAIDDNSIIASALLQDYDASGGSLENSPGAAYIFTRSGSTWSQQQKIVGQGTLGRNAGDRFGYSVDIKGDRALVGAILHSYDENGVNSIVDAGAMFVYDRSGSTWNFAQKIVPSGYHSRNQNDSFGWAVSLGIDAVVGGSPKLAVSDSSGGSKSAKAGGAFVFDLSSGSFVQRDWINAGDNRTSAPFQERFGRNVAISSDGLKMIGCADYHDFPVDIEVVGFWRGAAYFFNRNSVSDGWTFQQKIAGTYDFDRFCGSVAIDGDTAVIGSWFHDFDANEANNLAEAGAAFVYTEVAGSWTLEQKLVGVGTNGRKEGDYFARSLAIDGDTIVVGAYLHDYDETGGNLLTNPGAAYVYTRSGTNWSLEQKLVAEGTNARNSNDLFGFSLDIDGDTILIGSRNHSYDALGVNNINDAGAVFVYVRSGGSWSLEKKLVAEGSNGRIVSDLFGYSLSISGDIAVISSVNQSFNDLGGDEKLNAGAAFIYERTGTNWSLQKKLVAQGLNGRQEGDKFGYDVSTDGTSIIVGAVNHDYDFKGEDFVESAGAAYVYRKVNNTWKFSQKLTPLSSENRTAIANFGIAVSIIGGVPVVGSYQQNIEENNFKTIDAGSMYTYGK